MVISAVQRSESAMCKRVSPPSWVSLPAPRPSHPGRHRDKSLKAHDCFKNPFHGQRRELWPENGEGGVIIVLDIHQSCKFLRGRL